MPKETKEGMANTTLEEGRDKTRETSSLAQQRDDKGRFQRVPNPKNYIVRTTLQGRVISSLVNILNDFQLENYWVEIYPNSIFIRLENSEIKEEDVEKLHLMLSNKLSKWIQAIEYHSTPSLHLNRYANSLTCF